MDACKNCGMEIKWRTIYGQKVRIDGCECGEDSRRRLLSSKESLTREIRCSSCHALVFYVRHNDGCVWLDELGPPWPKHPCYSKMQGSTQGLEEILDYEPFEGVGTIVNLTLKTDLAQRIVHLSFGKKTLEIYLGPEFWDFTPAVAIGEQIFIETIDNFIRIRDEFDFYYWPVQTGQCEDCGQLFLKKKHHLELCLARKERYMKKGHDKSIGHL